MPYFNYFPKEEKPQSTEQDNVTMPGQSLPLHVVIRDAMNGNQVQTVNLRYGSDIGEVTHASTQLDGLTDRHITLEEIETTLNSYQKPDEPAKQEPTHIEPQTENQTESSEVTQQ